jgi:hypothetical protein
MKHTHLDRWTCASGKWMIPRHEWSPRYRIAHGWKIWVWICHQGTWELMKQKELRSIFIIFYYYFISFSFFSLSFFFLLPFSPYFSFLLIIMFLFSFFYFAPQNFLQHNTYITFVRDDVMTPPPCLNDARPRAQKRGEMTAKVSINFIILHNIWISIENFTPYSNWVVDKEVITKRCFWFRVDARRSLWNFRCENPQCMDKKAGMKSYTKEWPAS